MSELGTIPTLDYVPGDVAFDGTLVLRASPRYTDLIAKIPGFLYVKDRDEWIAAARFNVAIAARGVLGDVMELTPGAIEWAERRKDEIRWSDQIRFGQFLVGPSAAPLYQFQGIGTSFLALRERVLLGDEMGTGKTVMASAALQWLGSYAAASGRVNPYPALIVCTNTMKWAWKKHLADWAGIDSTVIDGTASQRMKQFKKWKGGALIIHWDALRLHSRLAGYGSIALTDKDREPGFLNEVEWATVIADEAHKAKDPTAKCTRALWAVSADATYHWGLSGTLITGKAEDLWSMLHFLDPHAWPVRKKWMDRYVLGTVEKHRGKEHYTSVGFNPLNEAELQATIRPYLLRRTKAEVLPQLPAKIYRKVWVRMGAKQEKVYETLAEEMMAALDSGTLVAGSDIVKNVRLGQAASGYLVIEPDSLGEDRVKSLDMPSCKVDALMDILDETDEQIVVGAESRLLIELCARQLEKAKVSHVLITGRVSPEERTANVAAFQSGGVRVCLVTLGAGAEGITLTAASKLVFLQRSFSMTANLQFQDRIHRIGQEADSVEIIDVLTEGTTDEDRWLISNDKEGVAQQVYNDPAYIRQRLTR